MVSKICFDCLADNKHEMIWSAPHLQLQDASNQKLFYRNRKYIRKNSAKNRPSISYIFDMCIFVINSYIASF